MWDSVSLLEQCLGVLFNAHQFLPLSLFVDVSLSLLLREALLLEPRIITDPSPLPFVVSFAALCRIQPIRVPSSSPFECFNRAVSRVQDSALSIRQNRPDYTDHRGSDRPIVSSRWFTPIAINGRPPIHSSFPSRGISFCPGHDPVRRAKKRKEREREWRKGEKREKRK